MALRLGGLADLDPAAVPLPPGTDADIARAERVLRAARDQAARRWLDRAPGPWGADAPPAPEATFDD